MDGIAAVDFLVVPTPTFECLFAFAILGVGRRKILWIGITANPTAERLSRQITEAFPLDTAPQFLVRDNDGAYGEVFGRRLRSMGIRDRPISPRSPWQNCYVERVVGSIRRECLDHTIIWNAAHLRHILNGYTHYYMSCASPRVRRQDERGWATAARLMCRGRSVPMLRYLNHLWDIGRPKTQSPTLPNCNFSNSIPNSYPLDSRK